MAEGTFLTVSGSRRSDLLIGLFLPQIMDGRRTSLGENVWGSVC